MLSARYSTGLCRSVQKYEGRLGFFSTLPVIWLPTVTSAYNGDPCFSVYMLCSAGRKVIAHTDK